MPLSRFQRVVIVCPTAVTGGPEALHQLGHALTRIGVDCTMAYVGEANTMTHDGDRLVCTPPENAMCMEAYAEYAPRVAAEIRLDADTLVVIPEVWAVEMHALFREATLAIWWLSIDNAFVRQPELRDRATCRRLLHRERILHLHQSAYAKAWLLGQGLEQVLELGDYTSRAFTAREAAQPSPKPLASYNPEKGGDAAERLFAPLPQYDAIPLRGFSKPRLREVFSERLIYVDCGGFPGKDRIPREAAISGAVVFVRRLGAAAVHDDFPLPDYFRFTDAEANSGALRARLAAVARDPEPFWRAQADFRSRIRWEETAFNANVARLWGNPTPLEAALATPT